MAGTTTTREIELDELQGTLDDLRDAMENAPLDSTIFESQQRIATGIAENFERTQMFDGTPWPPHAPSTVKQYGPHPLLILSGDMRLSATSEGAPFNVYEVVNGRELTWGTNIIYAATQNFGRDHIPQREFVYVAEHVADDIQAIVATTGIDEVFAAWR